MKTPAKVTYELPIKTNVNDLSQTIALVEELSETTETLHKAMEKTILLLNELSQRRVIIEADLGEPAKVDIISG